MNITRFTFDIWLGRITSQYWLHVLRKMSDLHRLGYLKRQSISHPISINSFYNNQKTNKQKFSDNLVVLIYHLISLFWRQGFWLNCRSKIDFFRTTEIKKCQEDLGRVIQFLAYFQAMPQVNWFKRNKVSIRILRSNLCILVKVLNVTTKFHFLTDCHSELEFSPRKRWRVEISYIEEVC